MYSNKSVSIQLQCLSVLHHLCMK